MAFATISELTNGREISLGLGPGSRSILTHQVERAKPLTIMCDRLESAPHERSEHGDASVLEGRCLSGAADDLVAGVCVCCAHSVGSKLDERLHFCRLKYPSAGRRKRGIDRRSG